MFAQLLANFALRLSSFLLITPRPPSTRFPTPPPISTNATATMPPKTSSIWENTSFLVDLAVVLHEAALHGGALTPAVKGSMEESLRKQGYDTSWNAIR
ncbi:hypothetical protein CDD83_10739 [Cordyceps sp. RAO-2017]|nr:hypothetical protein CDD83_10739 [Cordyceps sp. RAO-2017]